MDTPENLRYTDSHEWIGPIEDGVVTVGITDHAQDQLGDVVFVELPRVGSTVVEGDAIAVVESVKTASDIYAPLSGTIVAVNEVLDAAPETINDAAFGDGWLFKLRPDDPDDRDGLLDAAGYRRFVQEEEG